MKLLALFFLAALPGCVLAPKPPHLYAGVQRVTLLDTAHRSSAERADDFSAYLNLLFPIGETMSFQVEPIFPFNGEEPLLRVAVDVKLF